MPQNESWETYCKNVTQRTLAVKTIISDHFTKKNRKSKEKISQTKRERR